MKRDAVGAFSPQMIAAIDPRSAADLTTDKVAALDTGQTTALKPEQLAAFPIIRSMRLWWISSCNCSAQQIGGFSPMAATSARTRVARHRVIGHPAHNCGHQD